MITIETNAKPITLEGEETHVHFASAFPYFWVRNDSGGTVQMSIFPNISEGKDGVIEVLAGGSSGTMHGYNATCNDLYLIGSGKVQVMGTYTPENPFKQARKGGDIKPTPTDFDMTGITARFDVPGIDIENKIWTNSVVGGENLTFTEGSLVDNSLMIPGYQYGSFPLTDNPDVIYLVAKKNINKDEDIIFGQGSSIASHGYRVELFILVNKKIQLTVFRPPYIETPIDINKWHLYVIIRDFDKHNCALFVDGIATGILDGIYNDGYTGKMYLNCNMSNSSIVYQAYNHCYFKHISTGTLFNKNDLFPIYNNMGWLMKNIVNPANEEV